MAFHNVSRRRLLNFLAGSLSLILSRLTWSSARSTNSTAEDGRTTGNGSRSIGELQRVQNAAEKAANVTPINYAYPVLDIRRYGGDNTGARDNHAAFTLLFKVMLYGGGASAVLPAGKYNLGTSVAATLTNAAIPTSTLSGLNLYAYGAVVNFSGTGYAFDFLSPNTSATFYQPGISIFGLNIEGSPRGAGGIRSSDLSSARYVDVFIFGFTAPALGNEAGGTGFTLRNTVAWSENTRFIGCGVVNCTTGMAFVNAGGTTSFARTYVEHFFGAGITNFWFDIGGACAVYDSRFTHVAGNFGALAYFAIGKPGSDADLSSTVIDGIDAELNGAVANQSIFRLRNFPNTSSIARRPKVLNISLFSGYTGKGSIPTWANNAGAAIPGPEPTQLQSLDVEGPVSSSHGQSTFAEPSYNVGGASRNVATTNSALVTCSLTGCISAVSGRVTCARSGNHVSLSVYDQLNTGTSNSNTMTLTGLTSEYWPSAERAVACFVENDGKPTSAIASIAPTGLITFSVATAFDALSKTGFSASGKKGLSLGMTLSYPL
jgi:hypothetical protein